MKCPECRFINPDGMKFCGECGYDLRLAMEISSKANGKLVSYTPKFLADKVLTEKFAVEGERKQVSVLFADVANYTSMAERFDPEEVHRIMDGCFAILLDEIHEREGTINQFVGDGVMALFGAPMAHEDHAQRACVSALAIQQAIEKYSSHLAEKFGVEFKMRMGINSGPVVVGAIGDDLRMDYTAVGDTTNLASRLMSMAKPGAVLISSRTCKIVRKFFKLKALGKMDVKGKKNPVEVFELVGHLVYRARLGVERMIYSEMVGRQDELDILEFQIAKAKKGQGSIVNVIGEAGIGKSRLIAELKKNDAVNMFLIIEGRAISIGRNLYFHPFNDLFKEWARIKKEDTEAVTFQKLEFAIKRFCPEDVPELIPFLALLMGIKLSGKYADRVKGIEGDALEKIIAKKIRDLLRNIAEISPLLIIMEDLHWADQSSIELLESLFRLVESQKIVFINVFRPGYKEIDNRIVATVKKNFKEYYVEILLKPLNKKLSESLVSNMLRTWGLPKRVMYRIVEQSGGNPFFLEEVVRSLIDDGAIILKNGNFRPTEKLEETIIPQSINDVLTARIDRLEENTRNLVKVASVIGRSFFYRVLMHVGREINNLDQRLVYLKKIQLIRERKRMGELEYLFKHSLVQETAYESILISKRRELHLSVAESIENIFKDRMHEFYGMLAYHYGKAANEEKAQNYLLKAGEEALKSSASSEALHFYQEALKLYLKIFGIGSDPERVALIEKNIALSLHYRGRYSESIAHIDNVLKYYGFTDPKNIVSKISRLLSGAMHLSVALYLPFFKWRKTPSEKDQIIIDLCLLKAEMYTHTEPVSFFISFSAMIKNLTKFQLEKIRDGMAIFIMLVPGLAWPGISFRFARKIIDSCDNKIKEDDTKALMCHLFGRTMISSLHEGFGAEQEYWDEPLIESALNIGEFFLVASYLIFGGWIEVERGDFKKAEIFQDKLHEIAETFDNDYAKAIIHELSIRMYLKNRKLSEALSEADKGILIQSKAEFNGLIAYMYGHKVQAQIILKDTEGAEKSLKLAVEYQKKAGILPLMWLSAVNLGQFIFALYRLEEFLKSGNRSEMSIWRKKALKWGKKEIKIVRKLAQDRTAAYRHMGGYYWLIGRKKKALLWWNRSVKEGERLNAKVSLSRTYFEMGKRLLEEGSECKMTKDINGEDYFKKAEVLFLAMELTWDLKELQKFTY